MKNFKTVVFIIFILFFAQLYEIETKTRSVSFGKLKIRKNNIKESNKSKANNLKIESFIKNRNVRDLNQSTDLWIKCSGQNQNCVLPSGTYMVKYGIETSWKYKELSGTFGCNNGTFGQNQSESSCWIKNHTYSWKQCSTENGTCEVSAASIIRYGADNRWTYQYKTENVSCSNSVFGDPAGGASKSCFILEDNTWRHCANQNGECKFLGSSIVRYGVEGKFNYRFSNGDIDCNDTQFGDPFYGKSKSCQVRVGPIIWVPCANENGNCTVPGEAIVRYGANTIFSYKKSTNSISCNNSTFGDPVPGAYKKCDYAVYNNQDLPAVISTLDDQEVDDPVTENEASSFSYCSDNNGFGFTGTCLTRPSALASSAPQDTKNQSPFIFGVLGNNPLIQYNFCVGDFTGEDLQNDYEMNQNKCNTIPLMKEYKYGSMSGVMKNVPCGKTVEVAFCFTFDRCGTVAMVVNGGLMTCAAAYSTGIGAIISLFSDVLDHIGFGISVKRRFTYDMDLAFRNGSSVDTKSITTYGHFFLKIGLSIPLGDLSIGGKKLKDFFTFNIDALLMVDFGNAFSTVSSIITEILNANKDTGRNIVNKIVQTNSEITFTIMGSIVLNINSLTNGFLPDIEINVAQANLLLTLGNGGASGLNRGVYFYYSSGINNISQIFDAVVAPIKPLLNLFGVSLPSINFNLNVGFGMFVSDDSLGLTLVFPGLSLYCLCIYSNKSCSCGVNGSFFTALLEAGKWLVKQARQIAETVGKVAVEFANETGKFAVNAANATANFFKNDARNFFERDVKNALGSTTNEVGNFFKNEVGSALNSAGNAISNTASTVGNAIANTASTVGNAVSNTASTVGNAVSNTASSVGKSVKKVFKKW